MKKAVIIIPTYNEKDSIRMLVEQIFKTVSSISNWSVDVIVVDSHSPDGTQELVESLIPSYPHLHLIRTQKEGLGKAYMEGFKTALDKFHPFVLFEMDADLSHDPLAIPLFLNKIEQGADFVIGSRYIRGGSIPTNWGLDRKIFSIGASLFVRFGFMRLKITDWTSGFRAIKSWVIRDSLTFVSTYSGYVFQVALLDHAISKGARISEVPINFVDRTAGVSKINSIQYILQTIWYVLSHSSFIKFVIVGVLGFIVDFSFAYAFINSINIPKASANMLSAEVAIIFNFFINNFWSFRHKKIEGGFIAYAKKLLLFNLVSLGSVLIQGGGIYLLLTFIGDRTFTLLPGVSLSSWIVYKIGIIAFIIIPYSYVLYNKVVWKR